MGITLRQFQRLIRRAALKYAKELNSGVAPNTTSTNTQTTSGNSPPSNSTIINTAIQTQQQQSPNTVQGKNLPLQTLNVPQRDIKEYLQFKEGYDPKKHGSKYLQTIVKHYKTFFPTGGRDGEIHPDDLHSLHYLDSHGLLEKGVLPGLSSAKLAEAYHGDMMEQYDVRMKHCNVSSEVAQK